MTVKFKENDNEWKGWIIVNRIHYFELDYGRRQPMHSEEGPEFSMQLPFFRHGRYSLDYLVVKCSVCSFTMEKEIDGEEKNIIKERDLIKCYRSLRKDCPTCATKFNSWKAWE